MGPQSGSDSSVNAGKGRTSRDLGAAPLCQKPAWPASGVVRDPTLCSSQGKRGQGPHCFKGREPKDPATQEVAGVATPLASARLLRQLLVRLDDRAVRQQVSLIVLSLVSLPLVFFPFTEDAMSTPFPSFGPLWTVQASLLPFSSPRVTSNFPQL